MKGVGVPKRRMRSIGTLMAVLAGAVLGVAGPAGIPPPAAAAPVSLNLRYTCDLPMVGAQPMTVRIESDLPAKIGVGQQTPKIVIDTVSEVNDATTQGLNLVEAVTIEGTALAESTVAVPGITLPLKVPFTLAETAVPASGAFEVPATGDAPALTFAQPGTGTIRVGDITLQLQPRDRDGNLTGLGDFAAPCRQDPGQNNVLSTFTITEEPQPQEPTEPEEPGEPGEPGEPDTTPPTAPGRPTGQALSTESASLTWPAATDDVGVTAYDVYEGTRKVAESPRNSATVTGLERRRTYAFTVRARDAAGNVSAPSQPGTIEMPAGPPAECGRIESGRTLKACLYMAGYANVDKLDGASVLNDPARDPVLTNVAYQVAQDTHPQRGAGFRTQGEFRFTGPLRSRATFLTFGFMPTTATLVLTQQADGELDGFDAIQDPGLEITATTTMTLRLEDVVVDGAPLDVGRRCRGRAPIEISLAGAAPEYTNIAQGGPLRGEIDIPRFTGCGVGEDLDPLFDATVSASGNHIKIIQGPICTVSAPTCPPIAPAR